MTVVIPAQAGAQVWLGNMDSRFRGNDGTRLRGDDGLLVTALSP